MKFHDDRQPALAPLAIRFGLFRQLLVVIAKRQRRRYYRQRHFAVEQHSWLLPVVLLFDDIDELSACFDSPDALGRVELLCSHQLDCVAL